MDKYGVLDIRELRIGNILLYKGKYVQVTCLSCDIDDEYMESIYFIDIGTSSNEKGGWNRSFALDLRPVSITPEILEKCGFERDEQHTCYVIWQNEDSIEISYEYDYGYVQLSGRQSGGDMEHIKHLHQLQNLFYALTGEELPINL